MTNQRGVLVVIDPTTTSQPALERAAWLTETLDLPLELFLCDYDQHLAGERFFDSASLKKARDGLIERHRLRLEKLAGPLRKRGRDVTVTACWDRPVHDAILRQTEKSVPRFVLKDTHYHSAIRRSLFSNTDWHLIRECEVPLWLVKPHTDSAIATLLAAVDPLHDRDEPATLDHKILKTAEDIRKALGGRTHAVHAFDPAPVYAVATDGMSLPVTEPILEAIAALRQRHRAALEQLTSAHGIAAEDCHLIEGEIRQVLIRAVEDYQADVVVIGAVARGPLKRLALGSTAERVLDFVPCDLLIVKPDG